MITKRFIAMTMVPLAIALTATAADAQGKGKGYGQGGEKSKQGQAKGAEKSAKGQSAKASKPESHGQMQAAEKSHGNGRSAQYAPGKKDKTLPASVNASPRASVAAAPNRGRLVSRYARDLHINEVRPVVRTYVVSNKPSQFVTGGALAYALARGTPDNAIVVVPTGNEMALRNRKGDLLVALDDNRARTLGAWRVDPLDGAHQRRCAKFLSIRRWSPCLGTSVVPRQRLRARRAAGYSVGNNAHCERHHLRPPRELGCCPKQHTHEYSRPSGVRSAGATRSYSGIRRSSYRDVAQRSDRTGCVVREFRHVSSRRVCRHESGSASGVDAGGTAALVSTIAAERVPVARLRRNSQFVSTKIVYRT